MTDSLALVRLAGLLRSGISTERALQIVGGLPNSKELNYLIRVAVLTGSAVNFELDLVAAIYSSIEKARDRIVIASSAPAASTRLVIWLPLIVLALAQLCGLDVFTAGLHNHIVIFSIGFGVLLLALAKLMSRHMIMKAQPSSSNLGFYLLGVALASSGGSSLNQAQNRALDEYQKVYGCDPSENELSKMAEVASLVLETGAKIAELLRSQAELLQQQVIKSAELKIERLTIKLLLPLGLVVLPAFVFISIVPLMFSMLGDFR